MIDSKTARALFRAARACESDSAAGIAQNVAVSRILKERDAYREAALSAECSRRDASSGCGQTCAAAGRYCEDVVSAVDGGIGSDAAEEMAEMLEELGGWPPKRKRPASKGAGC